MRILLGAPPIGDRPPCALTIGNFDGVHRGHQALLREVVAAARRRGLVPAVMTFEPHPREFFAPAQAPARIANLRDKVAALADAGIERVFVRHFTRRFASLTAEHFIDAVLLSECAMRWLVVGDDFRFGAHRTGTIDLLRARASTAGFELAQVASVVDDGERISSSAIRAVLLAGDLANARRLLGRAYAVSGRVIHGAKLGRTLGFPTINLRLAHRHPAAQGIYAVRVHGLARVALQGVASVGRRPTIDDDGRWLLEVHLFDFDRDVYGRCVQVEFERKLRDEARYDTLPELKAAIARDAEQARAALNALTVVN